MNLQKKLGQNLCRIAAERNVSLEKLAYENEISKGYIYDIAKGKANVSLLMLERLAKALKVKVEDLLL